MSRSARELFVEGIDLFGMLCFAGGRDSDNKPIQDLAILYKRALIALYDAQCKVGATTDAPKEQEERPHTHSHVPDTLREWLKATGGSDES